MQGHEVAILIDNLSVAQKLSAMIRSAGVLPAFFEDLKSFWYSSIDHAPNILIVDVLKLSEGELSLSDHPLLKNQALKIVLYYTPETSPLLASSFEYDALGSICGTFKLEDQLAKVLNKYNQLVADEETRSNLITENAALKRSLDNMQSFNAKRDEKEIYAHGLTDMCNRFSNGAYKNFAELTESVFSRYDFINHYSIFELSPDAKRAVAYKGTDPKLIEVSNIFLGHACNHGFDMQAMNLLTKEAVEHYSNELVILSVKAGGTNPDAVIFINPTSEAMANFDWDFLEFHLGGIKAKLEMRAKKLSLSELKFTDSFEMMELVDRDFFDDSKQALRLANIDLSSLMTLIKDNADVRFYWDKFVAEFKDRATLALNFNFQMANFGTSDFAILASDVPEDWFEQIKYFAESFPYWRFFERAESALASDVIPNVRMVPASSMSYLSFLKDREVIYTRNLTAAQSETASVQDAAKKHVDMWRQPEMTL